MADQILFCDICGSENRLQAKFCRHCSNLLYQGNPHSASFSYTGRILPGYSLKQRYRIISLLGRGGMGAVYKAEDTELNNRLVAIKEMSQQYPSFKEAQKATEAFKQEAYTLSRLSHPHLPKIYDYFTDGGRWYIAMEFIDGETLLDYLEKTHEHHLSVTEVLNIGIQLCTVLDYLHTRQPPIIFRDLKPSNVMRITNGHLYLIDFGTARLFKADQNHDTDLLGSSGYAPPEQYGKSQTTPRSDIYSLGATLHHILTGKDPSSNPNPFAFETLILDKTPKLALLVMQMVNVEESQRPPTMAAIKEILEALSVSNQYSDTVLPVIEINNISKTNFSLSDKIEKNIYHTALQRISENKPPNTLKENRNPVDNSMFSVLPDISSMTDIKNIDPSPLQTRLIQEVDLTVGQWLKEGDKHTKLRNYDNAIIAYEQAIQLQPQNEYAYIGKGHALRKLRRLPEALATYDLALTITKENSSIWKSKVEILYRTGNYDDALETCNSALAFCPDNASIWIAKGNVFFKIKQYEHALDAYNQGLTIHPNNTLALAAKGLVLSKLGYYKDALAVYNEALIIQPKKTSLWATKGDILCMLKQFDEALKTFEHAHALSPTTPYISQRCDLLREMKNYIEQSKEDLISEVETSKLASTTTRQDNQIANLPSTVQEMTETTKEKLTNFEVSTYQKASVTQASDQQRPKATIREINNIPENTVLLEYFDVFLSHSETDTIWVEENLAKRLEDEHNFHVWLDKWKLIPGESWQRARARSIDQARCCAVCIGEHTPNDWFKQEIERALHRQTKVPSFKVIPVLLPHAKDINIDDFLKLNTLVDFKNADNDYAFHVLVCGIKGLSPGRWPPQEKTSMKKPRTTEDILKEIKILRDKNLIDDEIAIEYQRKIIEKVWLKQILKEYNSE